MAISANGLIATTQGNEDFLSHTNWVQFVKLAKRIGCLVWGRKTYEAVSKWEGNYFKELESVTKIIISHTTIKLKDGFTLANSPEEALKKLEIRGFKKAIVTGGATTNSEFAIRNLINEVIFYVNPAILGEGISIFAPKQFEMKLRLINIKKIADIIELRYQVIK